NSIEIVPIEQRTFVTSFPPKEKRIEVVPFLSIRNFDDFTFKGDVGKSKRLAQRGLQ
ncbi:hypothetical protein ACJX0J_002788, partial (mitochondrion) [Zea mays]